MRKILILPIISSFLFPISVFGRITIVENNLRALGEWDNGPIKVANRKISPGQRYFGTNDTDRPVFKILTDNQALELEWLNRPRKSSVKDEIIFQSGEGLFPESPAEAVSSINGYFSGDWSVGSNLASPIADWDTVLFRKMSWLKDSGIVPPRRDVTWEDYPLSLDAEEKPEYAVPAPGAIVLGAIGTVLVGWAARRRFQF